MFYSVAEKGAKDTIQQLGSYEFSFDAAEALNTPSSEAGVQLKAVFSDLEKEFRLESIRMLTEPTHECWTALPKVVYDDSVEREQHIAILMKGVPREDIEVTWHAVSKTRFKFLCLRRAQLTNNYRSFSDQVAINECCSDFEIGGMWSSHHRPGGSFLLIGCHADSISISSYLLGSFRAATYIHFDEPQDIPYLWLQHAEHSPWMRGLHEHVYFYGEQTHEIAVKLQSFIDHNSSQIVLNSLETMGINAEEETYGFDLATAFPAIMLSLDLS
jgi:hypothetical protein